MKKVKKNNQINKSFSLAKDFLSKKETISIIGGGRPRGVKDVLLSGWHKTRTK